MDPPPKYDPRYILGIEHFNHGEYFEAHEVWEDLWRDCPRADRLFFQSLIQAAVALYHAGRGNPTGANRLLAVGRDKMFPYLPRHLGLDGAALWHAVDAAAAAMLHATAPAAPPAIVLNPPAANESHDER